MRHLENEEEYFCCVGYIEERLSQRLPYLFGIRTSVIDGSPHYPRIWCPSISHHSPVIYSVCE